MKRSDAYNLLIKEYLSKCNACDECVAQIYCISNNLRTARYPIDGCEKKVADYMRQR